MKTRHIDIRKITVLRGPNMWTCNPVLEALIDIGDLEDFPSDRIAGFPGRLAGWMPSLVEHRCSYEERGGFLRRLEEGTWAGHVLEHVALELQALAGMPGGFGRARGTAERGVYKVIVTCWQEDVTREAIFLARDLVLAAMDDRPCDVAAAVSRLRELSDEFCLGPSTGAIVTAAQARGIPHIRLNTGNLVQLGYGKVQNRIWTAETERTSAIAEGISRDKQLTKRLLSGCGVPVPDGREVTSAADAWQAGLDVGVPVAVKPLDGNHGRGVVLGLTGQSEIEAAYAVAACEGSGVLVERMIPGDEHRLLVIGGRLVAAARGEAAHVMADGEHSVLQLIDWQLNSDPRRGSTEDCPLNPVRIDSVALLELAHQGLTPESVPPAGTRVLIQRNGNVGFDVTDSVHPEVAAMAILAARVVGLDIAGIDVVAEDITRPLQDQGGAIVEVNAGPGLQVHLQPAKGAGRPVGEAIVGHLFGPGNDGRVSLVGVAGSHGLTTAARLMAHLLQLRGTSTGLACADGLYLGQRRIEQGDCARWDAARRLLMNRSLEAIVVENGLRTMAMEGLAYDGCQVGIVTGLDPADLIPEQPIEDAEQLFKVLRTQVDVVLPTGTAVLNADDEVVAGMAELCPGKVIHVSAQGMQNPVVSSHVAAGGCAIVLDGHSVRVATPQGLHTVLALPEFPLARATFDAGTIPLLTAVGAAWALGLSPELIRAGIGSFDPVATGFASAA
jgi:cyanophycin synthetase